MSTPQSRLPQTGPSSPDIGRLWLTIKQDLVTDCEIVIRPVTFQGDQTHLFLELISPSLLVVGGKETVFVWSAKTFTNPFHLITTGQLFDLLIVGYRAMEKYFERGEAFAPTRRER